jgi:hypothetical protein
MRVIYWNGAAWKLFFIEGLGNMSRVWLCREVGAKTFKETVLPKQESLRKSSRCY